MDISSINFTQDLCNYLFSPEPLGGVFVAKPYRWAITLHDVSNNPIGLFLNEEWYESPIKVKSKIFINRWNTTLLENDVIIANSNPIIFDYPPEGETWSILYFVIWSISNINSVDNYNPIYINKFDETIEVLAGQSLMFDPNNLRIILNSTLDSYTQLSNNLQLEDQLLLVN